MVHELVFLKTAIHLLSMLISLITCSLQTLLPPVRTAIFCLQLLLRLLHVAWPVVSMGEQNSTSTNGSNPRYLEDDGMVHATISPGLSKGDASYIVTFREQEYCGGGGGASRATNEKTLLLRLSFHTTIINIF